MIECPICGEPRGLDDDEELYTCLECEADGYDCCVPGPHTLCRPCQDLSDLDEDWPEDDEDEDE